MLIFVFQMVISPALSLLVMGYGMNVSEERHWLLFDAISRLLQQIEEEKDALEAVNDPVAIDFWLQKKSGLFAINDLEVLALSVKSSNVKEAGGGIIGSPYNAYQPAQGQTEFITKDICILSYPGGPGVALIGVDHKEAEKFSTALKLNLAKSDVYKLLALADCTTAKAVMVMFDGCGGKKTGGGFSIKHMNSKKTYNLPENGSVSGTYSLEIYIYPPAV